MSSGTASLSASLGSSQTVAQSSSGSSDSLSLTSSGSGGSQTTSSLSVVATTPTTTIPTPSSTPVVTDSSSTPVAQTTPENSSSAANAASSTTTVPTSTFQSTTSFTSQVATTLASTDASGSVILITSTVPEVVTTTVPSPTPSSGTSSTGVIVGAVVGGVLGIALVALLLFCIRKRARNDDFDGNFDPDRVVGHTDLGGGTLPNVNLADDVTPFPQSESFAEQGGASMRQYGKSPYIPVPSSLDPSGHPSADFYPSGARTSVVDGQSQSPLPGAYAPGANLYGTGPVDWHNPRPGVSPPPSTVSNTTSSTRATKEREALGRSIRGTGLNLATQQEAPAEGSGDVVVHQDAGRAPIEEHVPPREIPPAYESIRQD